LGVDSKLIKAFDNYTSTLGLPFERRIEEPQETGIEERHREISEHLNDLEACMFISKFH